ncbi:MAG: phosphatase PAP2 family protein [Spirochaetales bacterium]|nr:phosphatase PAP2 family protein [Spirochaetales bacterium]
MQEQMLSFFNKISNPFLDKAAEMVTMLGEQYFFILVISFLFWNISKREGFKLAAAFIYSSVLNNILKISFHTLRPFEMLDYISGKRVETATGYSFPSGHTQGATTFFITLAQILRRKWFTIAAIIVIFLIGLTRIFLGVHWPVDVVGGIIFGVIMAFVFCTIIDNYYDDRSVLLRRIFFRIQSVIVLLAFGLYIFDLVYLKGSMKIDDFFKIAGISTGAIYGFFAEEWWVDFSAEDASWFLKITRWLIGLVVTAAIMVGLKIVLPQHHLADFLRYGLVGLWITFLWPAVGVKIRLFTKRSRVD